MSNLPRNGARVISTVILCAAAQRETVPDDTLRTATAQAVRRASDTGGTKRVLPFILELIMNLKRLNGRLLGMTAASAMFLAASSASHAGTATSSLSVTATVSANCTISTTPVAFGAYDPIVTNATNPLNGTGTVTVTCTNGSAATIALGQGSNAAGGSTDAAPLRQMKDAGTDLLAYSLYQDTGRTTIWGNTVATSASDTGNGTAQAITVYGSVAAGQNVPAGSYSDTVVATVTF